MVNSDEQVSKFVQAITDYAKEQREKILQEVEEFKTKRLQQAEQEVLMDAYRMIQKEQQELQNKASREMSRRELEARKKLLGKRRGMMDEVFGTGARRAGGLRRFARLCAGAGSLPSDDGADPARRGERCNAVAPKDEDKLAGIVRPLPAGQPGGGFRRHPAGRPAGRQPAGGPAARRYAGHQAGAPARMVY